jgi:hypothetical protein
MFCYANVPVTDRKESQSHRALNKIVSCYSRQTHSKKLSPLRIPTIPARDSNLKAATIPIEGGQYWPVGTFMGSQRW